MTLTIATAPSHCLLETNPMSNVASAQSAVSAPRGLAHLLATLSGAFEATLEVFAEAAEMSAAARNRFPLAD
jgi:hypothetical protein